MAADVWPPWASDADIWCYDPCQHSGPEATHTLLRGLYNKSPSHTEFLGCGRKLHRHSETSTSEVCHKLLKTSTARLQGFVSSILCPFWRKWGGQTPHSKHLYEPSKAARIPWQRDPQNQTHICHWVRGRVWTELIFRIPPCSYSNQFCTYYSYVTKLIVESNQIQKVIFCDFFFLLQSLKPFSVTNTCTCSWFCLNVSNVGRNWMDVWIALMLKLFRICSWNTVIYC